VAFSVFHPAAIFPHARLGSARARALAHGAPLIRSIVLPRHQTDISRGSGPCHSTRVTSEEASVRARICSFSRCRIRRRDDGGGTQAGRGGAGRGGRPLSETIIETVPPRIPGDTPGTTQIQARDTGGESTPPPLSPGPPLIFGSTYSSPLIQLKYVAVFKRSPRAFVRPPDLCAYAATPKGSKG